MLGKVIHFNNPNNGNAISGLHLAAVLAWDYFPAGTINAAPSIYLTLASGTEVSYCGQIAVALHKLLSSVSVQIVPQEEITLGTAESRQAWRDSLEDVQP